MDYNTCLGLAIIIIIIIIIITIVYKQFFVVEKIPKNIIEKFTVTTLPSTTIPSTTLSDNTNPITTIPTTTKFDSALEVKNKLESRYDEILNNQYANIQKKQELDDLTDRLNALNSELQKHTNSYMKYQASGELNFY